MLIRGSLLLFLIGGAMLLTAPAARVQACSGGSDSLYLERLLADPDLIFWGSVIERDNRQWNGLIEVEQYLVGSHDDARYLRISQVGAGDIYHLRPDFFQGGRCTPTAPKLPLDDANSLFFLTANQDGTYRIDAVLDLPEPASTFVVMVDWMPAEITRAELLTHLAEQREVEPRRPADDTLPRPAPLLLITENRSAYLLPVNSATPLHLADHVLQWTEGDLWIGMTTPETMILYHRLTGQTERYPVHSDCRWRDCLAFSPYQVYVGIQSEADAVIICEWSGCNNRSFYQFTGQAFRFSSTNESIAIWNGDQIQVHSLRFPGFGFYFHESEVLAEIDLDLASHLHDTDWFRGRAVWSPDGRRLAYSDANGLWLWDVYDRPTATLLIAADEALISYPLAFSSGGRYLHLAHGASRYHLDVILNETLPDGVISPDERKLLAYDTHQPFSAADAQICTVLMACQPIRRYTDGISVLQAFWRRDHELAVLTCYDDHAVCDLNFFWRADAPVTRVVYDPDTGAIIAQIDDFTLWYDDRWLDLTGQIDSPIQIIHWLLPVAVLE